jgi:endonuclease YncB( thermonuclease family)
MFLFPLLAAAAAGAACPAPSVHDGDTIRCGAERVRIADIDAPELPDSPKCEGYRSRWAWCDYALGYRSRDALRGFIAGGQVRITRQGVDRYGRTLALVSVNGVDAGRWLVSRKLARVWR